MKTSTSSLVNAAYYQFFFTNSAVNSAAIHIEVVVELAKNRMNSGRDARGDERETAFAIAHKAINDALDYDENKFVAFSHESFCPPNEMPELVLEVPTETLENGAKVWVRIIS